MKRSPIIIGFQGLRAPAPQPGLLWTPGYWGWNNGVYVWNAGYWGPHVGFYGGVPYGYGYTGVGFAGGYWSGGAFFYNRSVANIGGTTVITNVYNKTVINNTTHVSFNGGNGGLSARPTPAELVAANEHHIEATRDQLDHQRLASQNRSLRASVCGGKPPIAAVSRAADYSPRNVVAARGAAGSPVRPASLTGGAPNGKPNGAAGAKPLNANHGVNPGGPAGGKQFDAVQGTNKNAVANLNPGAGTTPKNTGPNLNRPKGPAPKGASMPPKPGGPKPAPQQKKEQHHS